MWQQGTWEEEELVMNGELREAFDEVKRENKQEHAITRGLIRDVEQRLNHHLIESAVSRARMDEHLATHEANKKWVLALYAGVIIALVAAVLAVAGRFVK